MEENRKRTQDITTYIKDQESVANRYVMKCFSVTMLAYTVAFVLNILNIFVIDKQIMLMGYLPSMIIYFIVLIIFKNIDSSNRKLKYFILFTILLVFTIIGLSITYHVVLISLLPFLYATLYSSKKVMNYVYGLTVVSTVVIVYGGYYFGLCDANMTLLTTNSLSQYIADGQFTLTQVNTNPAMTLMLFFVLPRCLIYVAFVAVCNSIFDILSSSLERAKLSEELAKAKEEAEAANKAKSKFLARVSHEIRTPINAVIGMNEMIIRESKEEEIQSYARDVKDSSVVLLNLINELLDSSKIESGKMELIMGDYDIRSLLNDIYNMMQIRAKQKNLQLVFEIDEQIPSGYNGDDKRIRQVLTNLLSNAIKYTEKGTVTLSLGCTKENGEAILHYAIKDTGIGIKQEDIGKIYDEFQRFDISRNRHVEGTGLGMNIVQQFLKLMNSELQITSEYGKGSEFSFDLRQTIVDEAPLGNFRERLAQADNKKNGRTDYVLPNVKILVVDDSEINLKVFTGLLKQTQMQITAVLSGRECLQQLKENTYDLVFLDHMMPEMDGIETLHAIKEEKLCEGTPIIMLTANAIVGDKERYLQEGFDDFLSKPIIPDKLDRMILKHLDKQQEILSLDTLRTRFPEIDFDAGMLTCGGDEALYAELFRDFVELEIVDQLQQFYEKGDFKNYCIRIHGFKNSAYSIGAKEIGDLAFEMEQMTREEFPEELQTVWNKWMERYMDLCRKY
ncbi:MAG: response regulator [Lachnospiraceae bacterium]|nr:response regulator [Lachnospiraceae bacterium]